MEPANQYLGEHLAIGNVGHFFVVTAFVSALVSMLFYLRKDDPETKKWGRAFFITHVVAVLGIFVTLFLIIQNHYFEYAYAFEHSSLELPKRYMISCFWEGQEGSFLLWIVWNALIGVVLLLTAKKWERGVLAIMALSQVVLSSMLLGLDLTSFYELGSSPFELLRDKFPEDPSFTANYMEQLVNGKGLNALLQNYWMVIHPPTLFLGFALTIVPFAFAVTSLFNREHRAWIKPALPWALAGGMILGAGIIMGGFWAYESLSFGGYWAWDPVENASLVPWLLLIAGIHLMLIKKATNSATIAAYTLVISSFIMVLYATFLTRSGVLGSTSVHSFTDLGLAGQLMQFVLIFIWLPIIAVTPKARSKWFLIIPVLILVFILPFESENPYYTRIVFYALLAISVFGIIWFALNLNKQLNNNASEDDITSREFWMFIGSLILVLSAVQVTLSTSLPVFNKIFGSSMSPPEDVIGHYNKYQLPIAIVIAFLTAVGQYFRYRSTPDKNRLRSHLLITLAIAVVLTIGGIFLFQIGNPLLIIFMLAAMYTMVANFTYILVYLRKNKSQMGGSIAHIGFGMMLLGVLVSSAKKQVITADRAGVMTGFDLESRRENMQLFKGEKQKLDPYWVTYQGDSVDGADLYFKVHYKSIDGSEEFMLYPNAQFGEGDQTFPNPDTKHYLTKDIYTHVTYIPKVELDSINWSNEKEHEMVLNDSIRIGDNVVYFEDLRQGEKEVKHLTMLGAKMRIQNNGETFYANPACLYNRKSQTTTVSIPQALPNLGLRLTFEMRAVDDKLKYFIKTSESPPVKKYIVMKAIQFPWINLLWLGTILMVLGFGIATVKRLELKRGN